MIEPRKLPWIALATVALAGCAESSREGQDDAAQDKENVTVEEYVSKTPGAKIYMQPKPDPNIVLKPEGMRGGSVFVDTLTGDKVRGQTADRERRINYYAYSTKDDELVRVFMTQFGGGSYKNRWKVFPIRVWNIEESKNVTPAVEDAQDRATIARLAEFISSGPDWTDKENAFMLIDAPISEEDPL